MAKCRVCGAEVEGGDLAQHLDRHRRENNPDYSTDRPGGFVRAFAWTAGLTVGLSLLSIAGAGAQGLYFLWYVAAVIWLGAVFVALYLLVWGKGKRAAGVAAGLAVGILALSISCFVNLQLYGPILG